MTSRLLCKHDEQFQAESRVQYFEGAQRTRHWQLVMEVRCGKCGMPFLFPGAQGKGAEKGFVEIRPKEERNKSRLSLLVGGLFRRNAGG